jgi:hypothetical protein
MRPAKTVNTNFTYQGPTPDISDLPCEVGAVRNSTFYPGFAEHEQAGGRWPYVSQPVTYAVYVPTDAERERIAQGENIKLGIYTRPIPPVSMELTDEEVQEVP